MNIISRNEFLEASFLIKKYVKQQELFYKESKNLLRKLDLFFTDENDLLYNKISIRCYNALISGDVKNIKNITIINFFNRYKLNYICKFRNIGRKSINELKDLSYLIGIEWK